MKIKPHEWHGKRFSGELVLEWGDDDALILELRMREVKPRKGEGFALNVDHGGVGMEFAGAVSFSAAVVMTEAEGRKFHAELGKALA